MNITTTNNKETIIDDISKEIDAIEDTLPDEVLDVSEPIAETTQETEVLPEQPETPEQLESLTEEIPEEEQPIKHKPVTWMTQLYAVDAIEDIYDRAGLTMILLGESARGMKDNDDPFHYTEDTFHVALRLSDKAHFERTIHGMADAWREKPNYHDNGLDFERNGVKVVVEYVDQVAQPYFNFPDKRLYQLRDLALPNPYPYLEYIEGYDRK